MGVRGGLAPPNPPEGGKMPATKPMDVPDAREWTAEKCILPRVMGSEER